MATPETTPVIPLMIEAGDTVTLNVANSPPMTVHSVIPEAQGEPLRVRCQWFDAGLNIHEGVFPATGCTLNVEVKKKMLAERSAARKAALVVAVDPKKSPGERAAAEHLLASTGATAADLEAEAKARDEAVKAQKPQETTLPTQQTVGISQAAFARISRGMSVADVKAILGRPTTEQGDAGASQRLTWSGPMPDSGVVTVDFSGGQCVSKGSSHGWPASM
jgi:hypothetical protein